MKNIFQSIARCFSRKASKAVSEAETDSKLLPSGDPLPPLPPAPAEPCSKVGIVIVSYFGLPYLRQCMDSIFQRTTWPNFRVVVVDNGSDDATLEYLRAESSREPRLQVVENGSNLGFAAANNIGLRLLGDCETLVLLNNDTVVPPAWLEKLVHYAAQPDLGMVGPVTNWTGNEAKIDTSYQSIAGMENFAQEYAGTHAGQLFDISVLAMYCVAFSQEVFARTGELDEGYKVGMFEDVDYAETVRKLGLRVVCCEEIFVHHYGMASFSKLDPDEYQRLFDSNREYFVQKWGHPWTPHSAR